MKVIFMGTGDIAIPSFLALANSEFELLALLTQPDKPVGRKQVLTPPNIKLEAEKLSIPVLQPEKIKEQEVLDRLRAFDADVFVVMAYGQILPQDLIDIPHKACINLHASLLPLHRGASCIQSAILAGDNATGVTVMHMTLGLDEGDMILKHSTTIENHETGGILHDRLASLSPAVLLEGLDLIRKGKAEGQAQDDNIANYAPKLNRQDGCIDWNLSATYLERMVRAYEPWPGTFTTYVDAKGRTKRLKIFSQVVVSHQVGEPGSVVAIDEDSFSVACAEGSIEIRKVQPEGSKMMDSRDFLASSPFVVGDKLGF